MDAGVPMKKPVSGIAMGLIKNPGEEKYAVLSDILGDEDHLGDMDFKTTGTRDGLTATQMDIKCDGLSFEIPRRHSCRLRLAVSISSASSPTLSLSHVLSSSRMASYRGLRHS